MDVVINAVGYDFHFSHTNLMKASQLSSETRSEECDDDEEGLVVFEKAKVEDIKVNATAAALSHEHSPGCGDEAYDFLVKICAPPGRAAEEHGAATTWWRIRRPRSSAEPGARRLPGRDGRVAGVPGATALWPCFWTEWSSLALASTALDGLDLAGGGPRRVEKVLKTTLGGVDRRRHLRRSVEGRGAGEAGAALNTSVGALGCEDGRRPA